MDPNKRLVQEALSAKVESERQTAKPVVMQITETPGKPQSISAKIKRAKTTDELAEAIALTTKATFASEKTQRRWKRQIEKKSKELSR
jgi:hypothetical protein